MYLHLGFLIAMTTAVNGYQTTHSTWHRQFAGSFVVGAHVLSTRSTLHCLLTCKTRTGCNYACYDNATGSCYLKYTVPESAFIEVGADTMKCYQCNLPVCCPVDLGYTIHNNHCIKFFQQPLNYQDARDRCAADGAHLYHYLTLDNSQEYDAMLSTVSYVAWVGADAINNNKLFVWSDGTLLPDGDPLWDVGQPDNHNSNQDCVSHWHNNKLNDNDCAALLPFICQIGD